MNFSRSLRACFDNIPFSKDRATATVGVLKQLTQLYSFTDIAKDSGAPYNMKIDLDGTLDQVSSKITNGGYKGDYAFEAGKKERLVSATSNSQSEFLSNLNLSDKIAQSAHTNKFDQYLNVLTPFLIF